MKLEKMFNTKDFYAGLIFMFFGIVAISEAGNYSMGTAVQMGPGYAPYYLGAMLTLAGIITSVRSVWLIGDVIEPVAFRPMIMVTVAVLAFTFLVEPFGLIAATLALVLVSAAGGGTFSLRETVVLYLVLIALALVLFVYGLKIPFKVLP